MSSQKDSTALADSHSALANIDLKSKDLAPKGLHRGKDANPIKMLEMCSVHVGQMLFGVPITHILEIVGGTATQAVPLAPEFVGGLFHYRGDVLTTVSLRNLLGLPVQQARQDILVLESSSGCFGLLVDSVGEVLTVSSANHEPNPSILDQRRSALFAGAYKLKEGLLIMLDPEKINPDRLDPMRLGVAAA
jgi:purine-binding chemotaxis protein CheW